MARGRLLPVIQTNGVITRSRLDECISSEIFTTQINDFSTVTLNNASDYLSSFSQNLYYSIWNLLVSAIKKFLYRVLHDLVRRIKHKSSSTRSLKSISFYTDFFYY